MLLLAFFVSGNAGRNDFNLSRFPQFVLLMPYLIRKDNCEDKIILKIYLAECKIVYTFARMNAKIKEKRKVRGYKITDTPYKKAMKMAEKKNSKLSTLIEEWVIAYSRGSFIHIVSKDGAHVDSFAPKKK